MCLHAFLGQNISFLIHCVTLLLVKTFDTLVEGRCGTRYAHYQEKEYNLCKEKPTALQLLAIAPKVCKF